MISKGRWFVGGHDLAGAFAHLVAPIVTTTFIILNSFKMQNGDILELAYSSCPAKMPTDVVVVSDDK